MKKQRISVIATVIFLITLILLGCRGKVTYTTLELPEQAKAESNPELKPAPQKWEWVEEKYALPLEGENLLPFRGVDFYPYPSPYSSQEGFQSLESLLKIKEINWVQIRFFLYQEGINSNKVIFDETQDEVLTEMIEKIHQSGRKVSLIPHFSVDNEKVWGALIKPTNLQEWFKSYQVGILHYARLAQQEKVDLFSVGNEMISVWDRNEEWEEVVKDVREVYKGNVTAKMNCWWQEEYFQKVLKMKWMGSLDYIGIAPYFDLTDKKDPTLEEIKNGWRDSRHGLDIVGELESISQTYQKEMIFLEIGFRSIDGTNVEPWNGEEIIPRGGTLVKPDQEEQALATQALFDVFFDKEWFEGVFWYYWPTKIIINPDDTTWSIPGKMVEQVIWDNFRKERSE